MSGSPGATGDRGLITVDRGNSTLDLRVQGAATPRHRVYPESFGLEAFLLECGEDPKPERLLAVTVVDGALAPVEEEAERLGLQFRQVGRDLPVPIEHAYPDPSELGLDRQLGAFEAWRSHGAALVVDCGTAVTWNLIDASGRFLGGAIGLGLRSRIRALGDRTPGLPVVDANPPSTFPAVTTLDALRAGVGRGFVREVEALATDLVTAARLGPVARVLTGGDAALAVGLGLQGFEERPELIHDALARLDREVG